jgi:3-hydroxymyristoyl/3-hydroxydecanoyl-(acyl carrier protein) dehydratase
MMDSITLQVSGNHPAFRGHFPGRPIVPGVLLLEWAVDAITAAQQRSLLPGKLTVAKFLSPVSPGEQLQLSYRCENSAFHFEIHCDQRKIASATFVADDSVPSPEIQP